MTRRSLFLGALAVPLAGRAGAQMLTDVDVVIVGAGAAGIAAARELSAAGMTHVVLEARDRVGGRAYTVDDLGRPFDMGAHWLHNWQGNPLVDLARQRGLALTESGSEDFGLYASGKRLPEADHLALAQAMARMDGQMERGATRAAQPGSDRSLASLLSHPVGWERFVVKAQVIEMGTEPSEISLLDVSGLGAVGQDMVVAGGYGALVADHARGLNSRLSATVSEIRWQEAHGVTLSGAFGTLRARAAIVTVPTSVLAQNTVRFAPALPARMQQAIADLPFGVFEKVGFRLDRARPDLPEYAFATGPEGQLLTHALAMSEDHGIATIILAGDTARALVAEGTAARIATARSLLTDILGSDTAAGATVATNWLDDPLSLGAYSCARIGATEARQIYSTPLENRLWFAGEAAPGEYAVTVAGAWLSGESAARAAAAALKA